MRTLIFSYYIYKEGPSAEQATMLDLWYRHLRGPGQYHGDLALCTNLTILPYPDIIIIPVDIDNIDLKRFWCERILHHDRIPSQKYDQVFQFDLDILAVGPIQPLFPGDGDNHLYTASSRHPVHWWGNAGWFMSRPMRLYYKYLSPDRKRFGYSAAIFGCRSEFWTPYLSQWAGLIDRYQGPPAHLGDQSFLNLAAARHLFPIQAYPLDVVQQANWKAEPSTKIFHFAGVNDRVRVMAQHSVL